MLVQMHQQMECLATAPHSNTGVINLERGDKYRNIRRYRPIDLLYSVKN